MEVYLWIIETHSCSSQKVCSDTNGCSWYLNGYHCRITWASHNMRRLLLRPMSPAQSHPTEREPEVCSLEAPASCTTGCLFILLTEKRAWSSTAPNTSISHHYLLQKCRCHALRATLTACCSQYLHFMFKILRLDSFLITLGNYTDQIIFCFIFRERLKLFWGTLGKKPHTNTSLQHNFLGE